MTLPAISVIMPVYNGECYLQEAIQSILKQSFSDFELIIIDDCSTDKSHGVIKSFRDKRIILLNNGRNIGHPSCRNKAYKIARGRYICVMDADDISCPHRLERQFLFMEDNLHIGIAASGYRIVGSEQDNYGETDFEILKVKLIKNNCLIHPSLIIRCDYLKRNYLEYNEYFTYAPDFDFIVRGARCFTITTIPEVLLYYRLHSNQITNIHHSQQVKYADIIRINQLLYLGIRPNDMERNLHMSLMNNNNSINLIQKQALMHWIDKILTMNHKVKYYRENYLKDFFNALMNFWRFFY